MKIDLHSFMNHILLFQNSKFQSEESSKVRKTGRPTFVQFIDYLLRIEVWFKRIMDRFCKNLIILFLPYFPASRWPSTMITGGLIGCTAISVAWTLMSSSSLRPSQRTPTSLKVNFCFHVYIIWWNPIITANSPNSSITRNLITLCKNWAGLARRALCFHGQTGKDCQFLNPKS